MNHTRRRFMRAAAAGGVAYAFGRTPGTIWAEAATVSGFSDYKALVCVFLFGGNDSWNMVVPTSTAEYNAYYAARGGGTAADLSIPQASLLPLSLQVADPNNWSYGLHPSMTGMQTLFNAGKCAVVANVGPLLQPTTKTQYQQQTVALPPQLFSHNDQQDQWHSLRGKSLLKSGWAGRVADVLAAQLGSQQLATNLSLAGQTLFQAAETTTPYVMGSTGATTFSGFGTSTVTAGRKAAFDAITKASYGDIYQRGFAAVQQRALQYADLVNSTISSAGAFTALPDSGVTLSPLATQLRTVAKMIRQQGVLGMSRQVFFVSTGGFDSHDNQNTDQPNLLSNVSDSLKRFYDALGEIGMQNNVTAFTHSDFGRTLTSNGDGSDHAWGGVQLVLGGAVQGGRIYGQYPSLQVGTSNPLDVGGGRFIPTTSADQYAATLARWFGVADVDLVKVAPNINNFTVKNLGFVG